MQLKEALDAKELSRNTVYSIPAGIGREKFPHLVRLMTTAIGEAAPGVYEAFLEEALLRNENEISKSAMILHGPAENLYAKKIELPKTIIIIETRRVTRMGESIQDDSKWFSVKYMLSIAHVNYLSEKDVSDSIHYGDIPVRKQSAVSEFSPPLAVAIMALPEGFKVLLSAGTCESLVTSEVSAEGVDIWKGLEDRQEVRKGVLAIRYPNENKAYILAHSDKLLGATP